MPLLVANAQARLGNTQSVQEEVCRFAMLFNSLLQNGCQRRLAADSPSDLNFFSSPFQSGAEHLASRATELMLRVFAIAVLVCECGGRMRVISVIADPTVLVPFLESVGLVPGLGDGNCVSRYVEERAYACSNAPRSAHSTACAATQIPRGEYPKLAQGRPHQFSALAAGPK